MADFSKDIIHIRMLKLMEFCVQNHIKGVGSNAEFLVKIGLLPTLMSNVISGARGFTKLQIQEAGRVFGASMDYVFGFSSEMFRNNKNTSALQQLKEAVTAVELELESTQNSNTRSKKKAKV